jgi:hypothetical protein
MHALFAPAEKQEAERKRIEATGISDFQVSGWGGGGPHLGVIHRQWCHA